MILTIKITKEVLKRSMWCSKDASIAINNCAISVAIKDIFPNAMVTYSAISDKSTGLLVLNSDKVKDFIELFDNTEPEDRLLLEPFSFQITLPDFVIEAIEIGEIMRSKTLELINT